MQKQGPIGFFDSGVGGTSIWRAVINELPYESTRYLADSANAPYGERSADEIIALSHKNTRLLLEMGCKLIVVACNTATTNAIDQLRAAYPIPFIGIEPAIKPAALQSKNKAVGILATRGTLSSKLFSQTADRFAKDIEIIEVVGTGLVPLIEAGKIQSSEMRKLLASYLAPMLEAKIDFLVLGCSHYPYLIPLLKELLPSEVQIIDSGAAVARQTHLVLKQKDILQGQAEADHQLYINRQQGVSILRDLLEDVPAPHTIQYKAF
ncbi:glutamate racemase [Croceiramulus getboli]|nr:glutamate racemase [Flavobacteriaceae bacterium YJPT1-3]